MAHGRSEGELASFVSAFAEEHGINAWEILYSREELKKTSMEYVRNPGPEEGGHGEDSIPGEGGRK